MSVAAVGNVTNFVTGTSDSTQLTRIPTQTLGQQDFLKLLVTQMTSQDPMNPQKDTDFIAQMASFSNLEQSKNMGADISTMLGAEQITQANSLIGRTVSLQVNNSTRSSGVVTAVQVQAGKPQVVVDGQSYDLSKVTNITPTIIPTEPEPQL
ncbi:MAG: flgD [Verrucomicrobiales bacterium]|nr:flgD [Verrucomicrobiales bacterium]MDB6131156.1 flgD [Verrucomicrobiales bacterium]